MGETGYVEIHEGSSCIDAICCYRREPPLAERFTRGCASKVAAAKVELDKVAVTRFDLVARELR
jgi:hypothetical protein